MPDFLADFLAGVFFFGAAFLVTFLVTFLATFLVATFLVALEADLTDFFGAALAIRLEELG